MKLFYWENRKHVGGVIVSRDQVDELKKLFKENLKINQYNTIIL